MPATLPLAKKKKAEILEEYSKLKERIEDAKDLAQEVHKQSSLDIVTKAKEQDSDTIAKSFADLKMALNTQVNNLLEQLNAELTKLMQKTLAEAKEFENLQTSVEISKQTLAANYHLEIGAEALTNLLDEYAKKQREMEESFRTKKDALEMEISLQKRNWEREQEELAYNTKLRREREQAEIEATQAKQEQALADRENILTQKETDLKRLQETVAKMPEAVQKEVAKKEEEILKNLKRKFEQDLEAAEKTWAAEKNVFELRIENMQTQLTKQQTEIASLKDEADKAGQRAQELAITVIEGRARVATPQGQKVETKSAETNQ